MKRNFHSVIRNEIAFFQGKLRNVGWSFDEHRTFYKHVPFVVNASDGGYDYRHKLRMTFEPEFLYYKNGGMGTPIENRAEVWIKCSVWFEYNTEKGLYGWRRRCPHLANIMKVLLSDIKKSGLKPFKDKTVLENYFTSPVYENDFDKASISFFINKDYPKGVWKNSTLING